MTLVPETVDAATLGAFGSDVDYTPNGGGVTTITGLFQEPDVQPDSNILEFLTQGPMVSVLASDAPSPSRGDRFLINGQNYAVKEWETDDGALVFFQLEETV